MSWLKTTSLSLARQLSRSLDPRHDYEPHACFNSFSKHWQQTNDIINKSEVYHLHDDVLSVINHLEQLVSLLELEAKAGEINSTTNTTCLDYLLSENLLDKLYEWAACTGKYENAVRLEQLKLYGTLVTHYGSQVIAAEPFLRPLLKLLSGFRNDLTPPDLEVQLVTVLNQLCIVLMQDTQFVDLFFLTTHTLNGSHAEFIIVRLLVACVHREGRVGACARDALLLAARLTARCPQLAQTLLAGNTCHILATGLSGLYSLLPRTLDEAVYRLTPDDVNHVPKLSLFIDSLEFCNAVAQVAHPSIKQQLLDLVLQGFLVPVLGPALLQSGRAAQAGGAERAAAAVHFELALRCLTATGLLHAALKFLLDYEYDGVKIIDVLLERLEGSTQLSLVSLTLIETLIDLNCEDVILELIFKYLISGQYLLPSYRQSVSDPHIYREASSAFFQLTPKCCMRPLEMTKKWVDDVALSGQKLLDFQQNQDRGMNGINGDIAMSKFAKEIEFNYGNPNESLIGNYHAYLCDARFSIATRILGSNNWSSKYDIIPSKPETNNNTRDIYGNVTKECDSLISICTSGYDTLKNSDAEKEPFSLTSLIDVDEKSFERPKDPDSISLNGDACDDKPDSIENDFAEISFTSCLRKSFSRRRSLDETPVMINWKAKPDILIGPLLTILLRKASSMLEEDLSVNCRLTSVISRLASLPCPILTYLLLNPGYGLQPNVPSLFHIISQLRDKIDVLTRELANAGELVDKARVYLVQREMALLKPRPHTKDEATKQRQAMDSSSKRRTLSSSFTHMFSRRLSTSSQPSNTSQNASDSQKSLVFTDDAYWNQSISRHSILNAVVLNEWTKELAALCEEHALRLFNEKEDYYYMKTVEL